MLLNVPRAQKIMAQENLNGLLGSTWENVYYLSGLESTAWTLNPRTAQVYAIVTADRPTVPVVVAGLGDVGTVLRLCPPETRAIHYGAFFRGVNPDAVLDEHEKGVKARVVDTPAKANPLEGLLAGLEEAGLTRGRLGYDEKGIEPAYIAQVQQRLSDLELVPAWAVLRRIRAVKTEEEIRRLKAALRLNEMAIRAAIGIAKVGIKEEEIIREYKRTVVGHGGDVVFNEITFGRRAAVGRQPIEDGVLAENMLVRFDVGCRVEGYCSDIARLFIFRGQVHPRAQRFYDALVAGEDHAMRLMRPGVTASQVFHETVQAVQEAGLPDYRRNHVGHAIGLEVYEVPLLGPKDDTPLEAGMVFEVETPYYEIGFAGLQVEDTVVVRENGAEMISTLPRGIEPVE